MIGDYGFRPDIGGAGLLRGGCGVFRDYRLEADSSLYLWFERSVTPGWGLDGGRDAVGPDCVINPGTDSERHMLKVNALPLEAGSVVRLQTRGWRRLLPPVGPGPQGGLCEAADTLR